MANGPTLPPQAYTREILTAAFNWLQTQPESVRRLAITPDALVGLFMRAQRYGASSLESDAPVSSQNFMSDLKNLAEGLKQFEEPRRPQAHRVTSPSTPQQFHAQAQVQPQAVPTPPAAPPAHTVAPAPLTVPFALSETDDFSLLASLNERSQAMIHEVKAALNLSSNAEVINMMISLGYKHTKNLLA